MCGIAGIFCHNSHSIDGSSIRRMIDVVAHRGPDGEGFVCANWNSRDPGVREIELKGIHAPWWLGHKRLSIIDLSCASSQPMECENGRYWICYNGEIYNYVELRRELEDIGVQFRTQSDTEVFLQSYKVWGTDCFKRLVGMFAAIIVDRNEHQVLIARDRFGIKPLYLWSNSELTAIVSEIKQLKAIDSFRATLDTKQAVDFIEDGFVDHEPERCMLQDVIPLLPASYLQWNIGTRPDIRKKQIYWNLETIPRQQITWDEAVEQTRFHFTNAVKMHLRSDVPVGSCLSGGIDSSSIVGVASRMYGHKMHTFSNCSQDRKYDEQYYIDAVNQYCHTAANKVFPRVDGAMEDFDDLIYHQDLPFTSLSVYAQYCILGEAKRKAIPVLLDGQGGDELMCGYRKYAYSYLRALFESGELFEGMRRAVAFLSKGDGRLLRLSEGRRYFPAFLKRFTSRSRRYLRESWARGRSGVAAEKTSNFPRDVASMRAVDIARWSLPVLLRYEDRNSMAHSIESRVPFLDHRLAEHFVSLPDHMMFKNGMTKRLLVEAVKEYLPNEVRMRRTKMGFDTPERVWMRNEFGAFLKDRVEKAGVLDDILDRKRIVEDMTAYARGDDSVDPSALFRSGMLLGWSQRWL